MRTHARLAPLLAAALIAAPAVHAGEGAAGALHAVAAGALVHDRGPFSDELESGVALIAEARWRAPRWDAWRWIGAPHPRVGVALASGHGTNRLFAGLAWEGSAFERVFASLGLGAALHDGRLHARDRALCDAQGVCGFGSRVLLHVTVDLGLRLSPRRALAVVYDHVSHAGLFSDENEGIDSVGLRLHQRF